VLARLRCGDATWEEMTPPEVAELVKRRRLLGYRDVLDTPEAA